MNASEQEAYLRGYRDASEKILKQLATATNTAPLGNGASQQETGAVGPQPELPETRSPPLMTATPKLNQIYSEETGYHPSEFDDLVALETARAAIVACEPALAAALGKALLSGRSQ